MNETAQKATVEPIVKDGELTKTVVIEDPFGDLLSGKIEPPSEIVGYFIEDANKILEEGRTLEAELKNVLARKSQIESQLGSLKSRIMARHQDVIEWYKKATAEE